MVIVPHKCKICHFNLLEKISSVKLAKLWAGNKFFDGRDIMTDDFYN